ncbi:MAG: CDP-diacylglycerol--serine O-phosphatidyltransferase [Deltaproteobacteria bacterium]|nr:CDP-diacylglycerol--serine O-phosphatidyltransferase [Deltaproteobacteria bacterium]
MKRKKRISKDKLKRGIYILPNIFTSLNMFCGFYAIIASIDGKYVTSAIAIIIAVVFDILDGKIARATNTTSKFGVEYDSLADLVSFGVAPGVMMYLWALKPMGRIGWLAAFLFMICGALRLARFNASVDTVSKNSFTGLPIPAAAGMAATTVLFYNKFGIASTSNCILPLIMLYLLSFLMVSAIKYDCFKQHELFRKMNFNVLVAVILILIFIAAQPSIALFLLGVAYLVSGPFKIIRIMRHSKQKKTEIHDIDKQISNSL